MVAKEKKNYLANLTEMIKPLIICALDFVQVPCEACLNIAQKELETPLEHRGTR
jgi:hypothetical protein